MKKIMTLAVATLVATLASTSAMAQISAQKASAVAKKYIGGGVVTDVDYKGSYYEVDVRKANGEKHEVQINANTGKVMHSKLDGYKRSAIQQPNYAQQPQQVRQPQVQQAAQPRVAGAITAQQAGDIAARHVNGRVLDVDFERKTHGDFYDVEVVNEQGIKYDVRIDASNGQVVYSHIDD